jgi:hypothetical protein
MDKKQASSKIKDTFGSEFDRDIFFDFIRNLLNLNFTDFLHRSVSIYDTYKQHVQSLEVVAKFNDGQNKIDVLIVTLVKDTSLDKARTMQRNFIARYLIEKQGDAALVAFTSPDAEDWRFSLIKMDLGFKKTNNGIKVEQEFTPAKRWSFLVGKNENSHTAQSQLVGILANDEDEPTLEELEQAFSIETVTNEFFTKYTDLFLRMKEALDTLLENDPQLKADFKEKDVDTVDFAKKTMGQMAFLYFLQKKGWFGVAPNKEWGTGVKNFLREVFERREKYGENFFDNVLEPLFYKALAIDRGDKNDIYSELNDCRMPFLNGGLFEPMNGYSWSDTHIRLPDELFSNNTKTKEGDIGNGILDVFDRYNFTVNESEPLEQEVAVDPEMLGKVFENLLKIKDRKSKGAFYTPREIVHYMCQESLINYLETETNSLIPKVDIESFIQQGSQIIQNDKSIIDQGGNKGKLLLRQSVIDQAEELDDLLANIKVCDPAVGSGAFPLGMLNEIVTARTILGIHLRSDLSAYKLKLHAISNSIYGVDIDPGAVEIAKLRFWLSLVVEEDNPTPLPNLEHKIMQGNSLVSQYEGIELFDDDLLNNTESVKRKISEENKIIDMCQDRLLSHESLSSVDITSIKKDAEKAHKKIKSLEKKLSEVATAGLFDKAREVARQKAKLLQSKIAEYITIDSKTNKENLKQEIDNLKWDLIEATLEDRGETDKLDEIKRLRKKRVKPFFIWKLEFGEVFKNNGGFDVVIANPPYAGEKKHKGIFFDVQKGNLKEYYLGKMDFFYFFFHLALDIGKAKSQHAFITTNYWITALGARKLRTDLKNRALLNSIINFNELKIFKSAAGQHNMITTFTKDKELDHCVKTYIVNRVGAISNMGLNKIISGQDEQVQYFFPQQNTLFDGVENYIRPTGIGNINNPIDSVLGKIQNSNALLGSVVNIHKGITTGLDKFYAMTLENFNKLEIPNNELVYFKDWYKNSDICKYGASTKISKKVLYFSKYDTNPSEFRHIYEKMLLPNREKLTNRKDANLRGNFKKGIWWVLATPRLEIEFNNPKIVVPQRSKTNTFGYNETEWYGSGDIYYISLFGDSEVSLKYILAILNSKLYYQWLYHRGKRKGETLELYQKPLSEVPINKISHEAQKPFVDLIDKILSITLDDNYNCKKPSKDQKKLEHEIDRLVYQLYDLTDEEIAIVEKASN